LNGDAASLMLKEPEKYKIKIKEYILKYASDKDLFNKNEDERDDEDDKLSEASIESGDMDDFNLDS
jgi:ubiquitin-conjugating enzyme E2 H